MALFIVPNRCSDRHIRCDIFSMLGFRKNFTTFTFSKATFAAGFASPHSLPTAFCHSLHGFSRLSFAKSSSFHSPFPVQHLSSVVSLVFCVLYSVFKCGWFYVKHPLRSNSTLWLQGEPNASVFGRFPPPKNGA